MAEISNQQHRGEPCNVVERGGPHVLSALKIRHIYRQCECGCWITPDRPALEGINRYPDKKVFEHTVEYCNPQTLYSQ